MSALTVFPVEFPGIGSVAVTERFGDCIRVLRNSDDVHVVGHQAVCRDTQPMTSGVVIEQLLIKDVVGVMNTLRRRTPR
jgi:hypothetical protein